MYEFIFDSEKNKKLINERNISSEEIICLINENKLIDVLDHHNRHEYPNQKIEVVDVEGYLYLVPFEEKDNKIYLKTIFPSRKHTKYI
jgi:uncharacterized DUF497 family protein